MEIVAMKLHKHNIQLGKTGEDYAVYYLVKKGYRVIERNFKARYGEIDIICITDDILVFVEVKTRIGDAFGKPEESVTAHKLREVIKTAQWYTLSHAGLPEAWRIDVIAVECDSSLQLTQLRHIPNVTQ